MAADSFEEYCALGENLRQHEIAFNELTREQTRQVLGVQDIQYTTYLAKAQKLPDNIMIMTGDDIVYHIVKMNNLADDLSSDMFELYSEKHKFSVTESSMISINETGFDGKWSFGCGFQPDYGALVIITTENFMDDTDSLPMQEYASNMRMGEFVELPFQAEEILPGLFKVSSTPLAARELLLNNGFLESPDIILFIHKRFGVWPNASTKLETECAIGIGGLLAPDFTFRIERQADPAITRVSIEPMSGDNLDIIYISPLLSNILPLGFSEVEPCIFEIFQLEDVVAERLVAAGLIQIETKKVRGKKSKEVQSKTSYEPSVLDDWKVVLGSWGSLNELERVIALPDDMVSFCVLVSKTGGAVLFLNPRGQFAATQELYQHDLNLEDRLMTGVVKVAPNIFKVSGVSQLDLIVMMIANGFHESDMLLFKVNMELYSSDLAEKIAFDMG